MTLHYIHRFDWCVLRCLRELDITQLVVFRNSDVVITKVEHVKFLHIFAYHRIEAVLAACRRKGKRIELIFIEFQRWKPYRNIVTV